MKIFHSLLISLPLVLLSACGHSDKTTSQADTASLNPDATTQKVSETDSGVGDIKAAKLSHGIAGEAVLASGEKIIFKTDGTLETNCPNEGAWSHKGRAISYCIEGEIMMFLIDGYEVSLWGDYDSKTDTWTESFYNEKEGEFDYRTVSFESLEKKPLRSFEWYE